MSQTVPNFCIRCEMRFVEWTAYHAHVTAANCARRILPVKISGRSKAEIVSEWETKNERGIIQ